MSHAPVVLSPEDFAAHLRLCQEALWNVQEIQGRATREIAAAQRPMQENFQRLVQQYAAQGLRPDVGYRLDTPTHSLIAIDPQAGE